MHWGGFASYYGNQNISGYHYYRPCCYYVGSIYGYKFPDAASTYGYSLLASSDGGRNLTAGAQFSTSSPKGPTRSDWTTDGGVIKPIGWFLSKDRSCFNLMTRARSRREPSRSARGSVQGAARSARGSVKGRPDAHGFVVPWSGSPTQRGSLPGCIHYASYGMGGHSTTDGHHFSGLIQGGAEATGLRVSSTGNGWVFFASHLQYSGPTTGVSNSHGGPVHSTYCCDRYYGSPVRVLPRRDAGVRHVLAGLLVLVPVRGLHGPLLSAAGLRPRIRARSSTRTQRRSTRTRRRDRGRTRSRGLSLQRIEHVALTRSGSVSTLRSGARGACARVPREGGGSGAHRTARPGAGGRDLRRRGGGSVKQGRRWPPPGIVRPGWDDISTPGSWSAGSSWLPESTRARLRKCSMGHRTIARTVPVRGSRGDPPVLERVRTAWAIGSLPSSEMPRSATKSAAAESLPSWARARSTGNEVTALALGRSDPLLSRWRRDVPKL